MTVPSAPTTSPAPHPPFRRHERLLPALVVLGLSERTLLFTAPRNKR